MQAFSDPSMNFLFVLVVIAVTTICCMKGCGRKDGGSGGSFGSTGISRTSGFVRGCGTCSLVLGMAFFYSFGSYGFGMAIPFLILGMCLLAAGSCQTEESRQYLPPSTQAYSVPPAAPQEPTAGAIMRIAQLAEEKGMLDERPDPSNPNLMIPGIRCPSCGQRSDLEEMRIKINIVHCPNCGYQIWL
jgi:hypothetical protein